ncbi:MAG: GNAT family N-acetyltransferase [Alphaproteobacteria bacterium]
MGSIANQSAETALTLRPAVPADAQALSRLARAAKAQWGYDAGFMEAARSELTVTPDMIEQDVVRVAERGGRTVGFYVLSSFESDPPMADGSVDVLDLDMVFVAPEAMGQGVGKALMAHAAAKAVTLGAGALAVVADPFAEPFYRHLHFMPADRVASGSIPGRSLQRLLLTLDPAGPGREGPRRPAAGGLAPPDPIAGRLP